MNKNIIIAIVVIILLLLGGGAIVMSTRNRAVTAPATTSVSPTEKVEVTSQDSRKSLKDLIAAGTAQKCTFKDVTNNIDLEGTSYIASGKVRADFSSSAEGKTTSGHTIFDGNTSYVWMDGITSGFKIEIDTSDTSTPNTSTQQGLDLNKTIDYSCGTWVPDQTLFNPPSDVTFTNFAVPTSSVGDSTPGNPDLCSSCNALSGEQKTQCLTALKCN